MNFNSQEIQSGDIINVDDVVEEFELEGFAGQTAKVQTVSLEGGEVYITTDQGSFTVPVNYQFFVVVN